MTSTALSAKNRAGRNIFLWTLKKNGLIIAITTIISLLLRPGIIIMNYYDAVKMERPIYRITTFSGQALTTVMMCGVILLIFAMNYRYLHNKSASDMFNSLPISRAKLFFCTCAASIVGIIIPIILSSAAEYVAVEMISKSPMITPDAYPAYEISLPFSLNFVFITLACCAMTALFAIIVGNTFDLVLSLIVVNVGWIGVIGVVSYVSDIFIRGFTTNLESVFLFAPFGNALYFCFNPGYVIDWRDIIYWTLFSAAALLICYYLIKHRRNESAGQPYAYKTFAFIPHAIVSFGAAFLMGIAFRANDFESPLFYIFMLTGALLGAIVYGAISTRGFKTIKRSFVTGIIGAVALVAIIVCARFDVFGYTSRLPALDDVKSVFVDNYVESYMSNDYGELTEKESIAAVIKLHEAIVNAGEAENYDDFANIKIRYDLGSGRTMERAFSYNASAVADELDKLCTTEEYLRNTDSLMQYIDSGADLEKLEGIIDISTIVTDDQYGEYHISSHNEFSKEGLNSFIKAYEEDLANAVPRSHNSFLYTVTLYAPDSDLNGYVYSNNVVNIDIFEGYTNTISVLEKEGVIDKLEKRVEEEMASLNEEHSEKYEITYK